VRIAKDLLSTDRQWFNQPGLDRFPTQLPVVIATLMAPLAAVQVAFALPEQFLFSTRLAVLITGAADPVDHQVLDFGSRLYSSFGVQNWLTTTAVWARGILDALAVQIRWRFDSARLLFPSYSHFIQRSSILQSACVRTP
jgi:hypothetical protein